ncbi:N-acetylneuraminate lyase B-like isoform X2 [Corticium candelabrum]|uniref:N-acetylneuraminate lyase B-like isoform X2 n=1 Tax=Corticium candelabrum TaxID=121492 RepID=UPI002E26E2DC|nr:N-acetylneuraminate lyase B-like isoform X2 [Corticium candelabrum]
MSTRSLNMDNGPPRKKTTLAGTPTVDFQEELIKVRLEGLHMKGIIMAVFSPFKDDGELNLSIIDDYANYLIREGAAGVFVGGSTGEGVKLSVAERKSLLEKWVEVVDKRLKVIVHIGSESLCDCKELARHAESCNVDAVAVMPPSYFKPASAENLLLYLRELSLHAPDTRLYYYSLNDQWSLEDFLKLADKQLPTFCGIKYSDMCLYKFSNILRYSDEKYDVMYGVDQQLLGGLAMGAKVCVGSTYNYMPRLTLRMMKAFEIGDIETSRKEQVLGDDQMLTRSKPLGGLAGTGKAVMKFIGIDLGPPRPPEMKVAADAERELQQELKGIGFFDWN